MVRLTFKNREVEKMCTYLPIDYAAMFILASSNKTRFLQNLIYKINTQKKHKQVVNIYKVTTNLIYVSHISLQSRRVNHKLLKLSLTTKTKYCMFLQNLNNHQNQVLYVPAESQ